MIRLVWKISKTITLSIIIILYLMLIIGYMANYACKDRSISKLLTKEIIINGSKQWISISCEDHSSDKPVVLFLHGGPGSANISLLNHISPELYEHAIIVNWDQRNAGKSFRVFQSSHNLNLEQIIDDAHELTQYLKKKFDVERISLLGFSAGTALGIMLIDRYPDDYDLFISVAQMVDGQRGEQISLDFTLEQARKRNDFEAIRELEKVKFDFSKPHEILKNTQTQRKYLLRYGGVYHNYDSYGHEAKSLWTSWEYSFIEFLFWPLASSKSLNAMWHEIVLLKIADIVPRVETPIVFFCGEFDMNNPTELVEEYYENIIAPRGKDIVIFKNSAHGIFWDEPERFMNEVVNALNKYSRGQR